MGQNRSAKNEITVAQSEHSEKLKVFSLCFLAVLLLFGANCIPEYATDTYGVFMTPDSWKDIIVRNGRVLGGLCYYIFEELIPLSPDAVITIDYIAAIVFLTISVFIYVENVKQFFGNIYIALLIGMLLIANLFSVELFLFLEKGYFCLAILLAVLAFSFTKRFLESNHKKCLLYSFIFLICCVYFYQVFLALYVILCMPFLIRYSPSVKSFLKNNAITLGMYAAGMCVAYVTTRFVFHSSRLTGEADYGETIAKTFLDIWKTFISSGRITPGWFMPLLFAAALFISLWFILKSKRTVGLLTLPYFLLGITILAFLPYFMGTTDDIYAVRIKYPFAAIPGALLTNVFVNFDLKELPHRDIRKKETVIIAICTFAFLFQTVSFVGIFVDRYKTNQMDKYLSYLVIEKISNYQKETGNEVTKICVYSDANRSWSHFGLNNSLLNTRAHVQPWSDVSSISFYAGKNFIRGKQENKYKEYFASHDWILYHENQLIFEGDTLHWCIY